MPGSGEGGQWADTYSVGRTGWGSGVIVHTVTVCALPTFSSVGFPLPYWLLLVSLGTGFSGSGRMSGMCTAARALPPQGPPLLVVTTQRSAPEHPGLSPTCPKLSGWL